MITIKYTYGVESELNGGWGGCMHFRQNNENSGVEMGNDGFREMAAGCLGENKAAKYQRIIL